MILVPDDQVGTRQETSLEGQWYARKGNIIWTVVRADGDKIYLLLCATQQELAKILFSFGVTYDSMVQVTDPASFLASIPPQITLLANVQAVAGKLRYLEVERSGH